MKNKVITLTDEGAHRIRAEYREIVAKVQAVSPGTVLAGGAIRDVYFKRPVKDLDFMSVDDDSPNSLSSVLGYLKPCLSEALTDKGYESSGYMIAAYETADKGVNLLLVKSVLGRVTEFPDSISRIWFDGEDVRCTAGFLTTARSNIIEPTSRLTEERRARIQAKYPDFIFSEGD